jgi:hypothetical protein
MEIKIQAFFFSLSFLLCVYCFKKIVLFFFCSFSVTKLERSFIIIIIICCVFWLHKIQSERELELNSVMRMMRMMRYYYVYICKLNFHILNVEFFCVCLKCIIMKNYYESLKLANNFSFFCFARLLGCKICSM